MEGLGTGLAALAFWGFIASLIVASIWYAARERAAQHETLRRIIESGKPVDQALMDKVLGQPRRQDRDLRIAGIIVLSIAAGVAILGIFLNALDSRVLLALLGVAGLLICIGVGLMVASAYVRRVQAEEDGGVAGRSVGSH